MSKFLRYIDHQFSNPTGVIGKIICIGMNIVNNKMYRAVMDSLSDESNILDIGYGNGNLIRKMYAKTDANIKGIDISEDMKAAATKRNKVGVNKGDIDLFIGDCCNLQFDNNSFDAVTTVNTIYFWDDTQKGLKEIRRVLKDDGKFYNVVFSKEYFEKTRHSKDIFKVFDKDEYIKMGKEAGFSTVSIIDIVPKQRFMVIYKK